MLRAAEAEGARDDVTLDLVRPHVDDQRERHPEVTLHVVLNGMSASGTEKIICSIKAPSPEREPEAFWMSAR